MLWLGEGVTIRGETLAADRAYTETGPGATFEMCMEV